MGGAAGMKWSAIQMPSHPVRSMCIATSRMSAHGWLALGQTLNCMGRRYRAGNLAGMADYVIPDPEPKEIDEKLAIQLRHLADNAVLKGQPQGDERCENCLYYLENTAEVSYCWHPKLRILVGAQWWCQWWEAIP